MFKLENIFEFLIEKPLMIKYKTTYNDKEKLVFKKEAALAMFLIKNIISIDKNIETGFLVNCNDLFYKGVSDYEEIMIEEIEDLFNHYIMDSNYGIDVWCIKKRGELPEEDMYGIIQDEGIWDLNTLGLNNGYRWD